MKLGEKRIAAVEKKKKKRVKPKLGFRNMKGKIERKRENMCIVPGVGKSKISEGQQEKTGLEGKKSLPLWLERIESFTKYWRTLVHSLGI